MKAMIKYVSIGSLTVFVAAMAHAQEKPRKPIMEQPRIDLNRGQKPPSGPTFYIAPVEGSRGMFSILLADGEGNTVAGTFSRQQIDIFQAVLEAAKTFAFTDEKVGSDKPIITRLMDQHEWSLFVDVSKMGNQSRFYVSLITPQGKLTAEAGEITRGSKKEPSALLLNILAQVEETKKVVAPPQ